MFNDFELSSDINIANSDITEKNNFSSHRNHPSFKEKKTKQKNKYLPYWSEVCTKAIYERNRLRYVIKHLKQNTQKT